MDPWNFAIYMVHNIANYWPKDNLRSILRHMSKYTVFRPDISEYQGPNFERDEKESLNKLGLKYAREISEIKREEAVILITTSQTKEDRIRDYLKKLDIRLIIHPNSGYDNISHRLVKSLDIPIIIGNEIRSEAVYLYTLSCFLKSIGDIPYTQDWDPKRSFKRSLKNNILIYGKGYVGEKLQSFFDSTSFDYTIYDPYKDLKEIKDLSHYQTIILACSLNSQNKYIINKDFLKKLRSDVTIINPARGKLIKLEELLKFLKENPSSKAYIDVFENEPYSYKNLDMNNFFPSSHIAGVYDEIDENIINFESKVIKEYLTLTKNDFLNTFSNSLLKNRIDGDILI